MKKLYAEYKDKGVEFIGVSLDQPKEQGGLDKLKEFVAKNQIEWPQYYQGNVWQSEFSMDWGINSIPCVFLVDADGKLATTEARGKLEKLIPEYLEKAKKPRSPRPNPEVRPRGRRSDDERASRAGSSARDARSRFRARSDGFRPRPG